MIIAVLGRGTSPRYREVKEMAKGQEYIVVSDLAGSRFLELSQTSGRKAAEFLRSSDYHFYGKNGNVSSVRDLYSFLYGGY